MSQSAVSHRLKQLEETIGDYLQKRGVPGLVKVHVADDVFEGAEALIKASGVGPLVIDYHPESEYADLDLPGPAKILARAAEFELDAEDRIDGRFHEHGRLDLHLRGKVTGTFQGMEFDGSDVDLVGTETAEGMERLLAKTEAPAHLVGVDRRGNP